MSIITSLLDNDLYKFTMQQAVLHQFPHAKVKYRYMSRNTAPPFIESLQDSFKKELNALCQLRFTDDELDFLGTLPFLTKDYIDFLYIFNLQERYIKITHNDPRADLCLEITGPWLHTILFEVPLLAILTELYTHRALSSLYSHDFLFAQQNKLIDDLKSVSFPFADFGTRRRMSYCWHDIAINTMTKHTPHIIGTSNVHFAQRYNIKPIGTMAHEWIQAGQQLGVKVAESQKFMFQKWADEYRGRLGIALTDTIGIDAFINDFDLYFQKLYDGVRHDSGDPIVWGDKIIKMYKDNNIDPHTKTLVFSDGLTFNKAAEINAFFAGEIKTSFGIGTFLTHRADTVKPYNHVIKLVQCNGKPVAKISDEPLKASCDDQVFLNYLKKVFGFKGILI